MSETTYRRRTIRLSPFIDEELKIIAHKNNMTVNSLVAEIIKYHINDLDKINNINNVSTIINNLDNIDKKIEDLQKKYNWLNSLTKQIFVNSGFAKNRKLNDDTAFQDFLNKWERKNYDKDFNS